MPAEFDLAVVGSGQGGVPLAVDWAARGRRVVLFERGRLGGCCVNVGCTPSKSFLASAHAAGGTARAERLGVRITAQPDVRAVMARVRRIVGDWHEGVEKKIAGSSVTLVRAEAAFEAPHVLRAGGETYEAKTVVLDTGAHPVVPPIDGLAGTPFLTNENFFVQETLPKRLAVLGSGYIGLELGQGAQRLGTAVTIVSPDRRVLAHEEEDVSAVLARVLAADGVTFRLGRSATRVAHDGRVFRLTLDDASVVEAEGLLVATGRVPNVPAGTKEIGIALDAHGAFACDAHLRTSLPDHYALGDAAGQPQFTHVSWEDFRRLRAILDGEERTRDDRVLAYAVFTAPQVGRAGLTEAEARAKGIACRAVTLALSDVARGPEWDLEDGFFRLVVEEPSGKIIGATFVGYEAGELIHVIVAHLERGSTWHDVDRSVHIHPTFAEGIPTLARMLSS